MPDAARVFSCLPKATLLELPQKLGFKGWPVLNKGEIVERLAGDESIPLKSTVVDEFETVWAIEDRYPVSEGHHLVIPKRHTPDWFSMTQHEHDHTGSLVRIIRNRLQDSDKSITGFNIGVNCGVSAGQTIFHAHVHLIPMRDGDTPDPSGGVRGVIPARMHYDSK